MNPKTEKSFKLKTGEIVPAGLPVTFIPDNPTRCLVQGARPEPYRVRVTSAFHAPSFEEIEEQMSSLVKEMNELIRQGRTKRTLVIFDEFADALGNARKGEQLNIMEMVKVGEYAPKKGAFGMIMPGQDKMALKKTGQINSLAENMQLLLQKGRSSGYRILAATQRASVNVLPGDAKVNFPVRICYFVRTAVDSKVVLDETGAEALSGRGDGLISSPEYTGMVRFQSYFNPALSTKKDEVVEEILTFEED